MAKGNPFLGTVSGSFGDLTLKNYRGKQVLTRKSTKPHNPRTSKQIYQRMFFATVGKARAALKNIIDHSFEQVPHGVDSLNYFQKRNIALLREGTVYDYAKQTWVNPNMNFIAPKSTVFSINPYRISEGSLPSLSPASPFSIVVDESADYGTFNFDTCVPWFSSGRVVGEFSNDELHSSLNDAGVEVGDFMTLVFFSTKKNSLSSQALDLSMHFIRFKCINEPPQNPEHEEDFLRTLLATNVDGIDFQVPNEVSYLPDGNVSSVEYTKNGETHYIPYIDLSKDSSYTGSFAAKNLGGITNEIYSPFVPVVDNKDVIVAAVWIHSRPDVERILTSTQNVILADPEGKKIPLVFDLETAFDLWTKQGKAIGDSKYLLEGGDV